MDYKKLSMQWCTVVHGMISHAFTSKPAQWLPAPSSLVRFVVQSEVSPFRCPITPLLGHTLAWGWLRRSRITRRVLFIATRCAWLMLKTTRRWSMVHAPRDRRRWWGRPCWWFPNWRIWRVAKRSCISFLDGIFLYPVFSLLKKSSQWGFPCLGQLNCSSHRSLIMKTNSNCHQTKICMKSRSIC